MTDPTPTRDEAVLEIVRAEIRKARMEPTDLRSLQARIDSAVAMLASAPAPASGRVDAVRRTGAEMIAHHRFRLADDGNCAEIDSGGLAEEIDAALASLSPAATPVSEAGGEVEQLKAYRDELLKIAADVGEPDDPFAAWEAIAALKALAKPASSPALQPDAVSEPLAPQPPGCSGGDVHSDLVKRLNALVAKPGRDWRTGDEFIHGVHSQDIVDIIREASAALSPATVGRVGE